MSNWSEHEKTYSDRVKEQLDARERAKQIADNLIENKKERIEKDDRMEDVYDALSEIQDLIGKAKPSAAHGFILDKRALRD